MDGLIPVREAARQCHRNSETIRRWIWEGKLAAQKLGNQWFVRGTDLQCIIRPYSGQTHDNRLSLLVEMDGICKKIQRRRGKVDVLRELERSREAHP